MSRWLKIWCCALLLTLVFLFAWESVCRNMGLQASPVADSARLWARTRERASEQGAEGVVLVGASRMQLDINLDVLGRYTPHHPVQLAIDGSPFLPVFEELSRDPSIRGTVIVSLTAPQIGQRDGGLAQEWLHFYLAREQERKPVFYRWAEDRLQTGFDDLFSSRSHGITPLDIMKRILGGGGAFNVYLTTYPDRSRHADYSLVKMPDFYLARVRRNLGNGSLKVVNLRHFDKWLEDFEVVVRRFRARGARVVLVRLPSDKDIWKIDESRYPRHLYWDRLAAYTSAETIHFRDYPELRRFELPDGSHLDYRDAAPFTEALARIIFDRGRTAGRGRP